MLKGIDINKRIEYISKEDKEEEKTVFVLKPLSGADMLSLTKFVDGNNMQLSGDDILAIFPTEKLIEKDKISFFGKLEYIKEMKYYPNEREIEYLGFKYREYYVNRIIELLENLDGYYGMIYYIPIGGGPLHIINDAYTGLVAPILPKGIDYYYGE